MSGPGRRGNAGRIGNKAPASPRRSGEFPETLGQGSLASLRRAAVTVVAVASPWRRSPCRQVLDRAVPFDGCIGRHPIRTGGRVSRGTQNVSSHGDRAHRAVARAGRTAPRGAARRARVHARRCPTRRSTSWARTASPPSRLATAVPIVLVLDQRAERQPLSGDIPARWAHRQDAAAALGFRRCAVRGTAHARVPHDLREPRCVGSTKSTGRPSSGRKR